MTRWISILFVAIFVSGLWSGNARGDVPVAAVFDLHGTAEIVGAHGKSRPAMVYGSVYDGEQLKVKAGGYVVLQFSVDRHKERVDDTAPVGFSSKGCQPSHRIDVSIARATPIKAGDWIKGLGRSEPGASVPKGVVPQLTPIADSTISTTTPKFAWPAAPQAVGYELIVREVKSRSLPHPIKTAATNTVYDNKPALKPGYWYEWTVTPSDQEGQAMIPINGRFRVAAAAEKVDADAVQALAASGNTGDLALAALGYREMHMTAEALEAYERLAKLQADEPMIIKALGALYALAGRDADAHMQWDRAISLFEKLSALSPDDASLHAALSELYNSVGRDADSLREKQKWKQLTEPNSQSAMPGDAKTQTTRRALLIGCSHYDNLLGSRQLPGAANDVELLRDVLVQHLGFLPRDISVLSESDGPAKRPTREHIHEAFQRLEKEARPDDQIVILLSGHGSLQPGKPHGTPFQRVFLPADVGRWDDDQHSIARAISDDDFHEWLAGIRNSGAYLWVIVDACHSGGLIRKFNGIRRFVPADELGVPPELTDEAIREARRKDKTDTKPWGAKTRGAATIGPEDLTSPLGFSAEEHAMVVTYASQASEATIEVNLPFDSGDGKQRGLFTYAICQTLTQTSANLTYSELIRKVQAQYDAWHPLLSAPMPTPLLQGGQRGQMVCGTSYATNRLQISLQKADNVWRIDAGALYGITKGSVLAFYPYTDGSIKENGRPKPLGHIRITEVKTFNSAVEPCEFQGALTKKETLADHAPCEVVMIDYGDLRIRLAADPLDNFGKTLPPERIKELANMIKAASGQSELMAEAVADQSKANWLLRNQDGRLYLVPASLAPSNDTSTLPRLYGPVPSRGEQAAWLAERLKRIARSQNLQHLAWMDRNTPRNEACLNINLDLRKLANDNDTAGEPVQFERGEPVFHDNECVMMQIENPNPVPIDVSVLYLDADYGINGLFPKSGEPNRLEPHEKSVAFRNHVTVDTTGREWILAIAVAASDNPIPADFTPLVQPSFKAAQGVFRARGVKGTPPLNMPLGRLLARACYGSRDALKQTDYDSDSYRIKMLSWKVEKN